ncbi:MAG: ribosome silencing factor [Candidatus Schekmanbacteria bacterium]|nr:ribosome silencing factor [Candidatus Schekmanbacteria bacterium]
MSVPATVETPGDALQQEHPQPAVVAPPTPEWLEEVIAAILSKKGSDLVVLYIGAESTIADYFVIVSGRSDRHIRAIGDAVRDELKPTEHRPAFVHGYDAGQWIVLDCYDVVFHVFSREAREHYRLERLWSKCPEVPVALPPAEPAGDDAMADGYDEPEGMGQGDFPPVEYEYEEEEE